MAAYAYTHTSKLRKGIKIGPNLTLRAGRVNITNYNTTLAAITEIQKSFASLVAVVPTGVSSLGHLIEWVAASNSFKAWFPTQQTAGTGNRVGVEVTTDTNVGAFDYIAIGLE